MKQKFSICSMMAISVFWLSSCAEKTEFVSSQSQSNWKTADPAALAAATPEDTPDIMPQTHYAAGRLFEKQGAAVRAAKQYKKALLRNPEHVPSLSRLGMLHAKQGHYPQAEEYLQRAVELWPNSPQIRNNLGFCYIMQERWYDAEAEFRNTLKLDPSFVRARVNLAMALSKLNRFDEALGEFRLAVPEPEAYYNLGLLYRSAQRYEEAASAFEIALKRKSDFTLAERQLARMKLQLQRTREFQIDSRPATQPTEFAANNPQRRAPAPRPSNTRANESVEIEPVITTQRAEWQTTSIPPKGATTASQTFEPSQPVANQPVANSNNQPQTQSFETQPQPANVQTTSNVKTTANVQTMTTMEPVESLPTHSESSSQQQEFASSASQMQAPVESNEQPQALHASSQPMQTPVASSQSVDVYEMQPLVEASESTPAFEEQSASSEQIEVASSEAQDDAQVQSPVVTSVQYTPECPAQQDSSLTDIPSVRPVYVAAGQASTNAPSTAQAASPVSAPVASDTQPVTPTKSAVASNPDTLVLEVTPIEMSAAVQSADQPAPKAKLASDLSEIESVEQVEAVAPKSNADPKKAKTATHQPNSGDVKVKTMGQVGAAPRKALPKPKMQAMPNTAPQSAIAPASQDMEPIGEANNDSDSDTGKDEAEVEILEMEPVEE